MPGLHQPEQVAAVEKPPRNSPRIGRFIAQDAEPVYFVFIEQKALCKCSTLTKAIFVWFCSVTEDDLECDDQEDSQREL